MCVCADGAVDTVRRETPDRTDGPCVNNPAHLSRCEPSRRPGRTANSVPLTSAAANGMDGREERAIDYGDVAVHSRVR